MKRKSQEHSIIYIHNLIHWSMVLWLQVSESRCLKMKPLIFLLLILGSMRMDAKDIVWFNGKEPVQVHILTDTDPVVSVAVDMFSGDMQAVTGQRATSLLNKKHNVVSITLVQLDRAHNSLIRQLKRMGIPVDTLRQITDGFFVCVRKGQILVTGRNGRGTAYGLLELSRLAGVSPWIWWGDVVPMRQSRLTLSEDFSTLQGASVEYRGVFLNDEDWSLRRWSNLTYEPSSQSGYIGRNTYKRLFQLLLRLRANAVWPAMHEGTTAFFCVEKAKEVADSCGIAIGTSHCEPLLRNNVAEWNEEQRGRYNFISNRQQVLDYWAERLDEVPHSAGGNLLTIGMRGIHDGSMEGVQTLQEKTIGLQAVIDAQQELIKNHIGDPAQQMQIFVPYKEVLQIYENGLNVPDYVTLMWCDDNYGYLTRLSNVSEQQRSGGAGVYYHLSYWGRPHDYLWLCTTQPGLIYHEMRTAYDHQARKLWIANVHDPKVANYDLELFLDMAWNIDCVTSSSLGQHYETWLCREFGQEVGETIYPAMREFYRLCGQRRPEFMGWSQVELDYQQYPHGLSPVTDTQFSLTAFGNELNGYLQRFDAVRQAVKKAKSSLRPELLDDYFATVEYPVCAAAAHARKLLEAQRARTLAQADTLGTDLDTTSIHIAVAKSQQAYQEICTLTDYYNKGMANGKWRYSMSMSPRNLPVFAKPTLPFQLSPKEQSFWLSKQDSITNNSECLPTNRQTWNPDEVVVRNACDFDSVCPDPSAFQVVDLLGHSLSAVSMPKNGILTYRFNTTRSGDAVLRMAFIPTQPNDGGDLRFSVSVDGGLPTVFSLKEPFRSEQWKQNVLRGQAQRFLQLSLSSGSHTLSFQALDEHLVFDQWMLDFDLDRKSYLFPR